jgi:hypothetical protein
VAFSHATQLPCASCFTTQVLKEFATLARLYSIGHLDSLSLAHAGLLLTILSVGYPGGPDQIQLHLTRDFSILPSILVINVVYCMPLIHFTACVYCGCIPVFAQSGLL